MLAVTKLRMDVAPLTAQARQERVLQLINRLGSADIVAYVAEARRKADVAVNPKAFE